VQTPFPSIRAVVFDLDGLMLNTEDIFDHAGRELMQRRGMEMSEEIHHQMLGRRPHEAFQILKDMTGIQDEITDLMHETRDSALSQLKVRVRSFAGKGGQVPKMQSTLRAVPVFGT
jgi:beta-phosphoglucomutase-like phosphatase (HAD superfamily)